MLWYFLVVCSRGSYSAAATQLYTTRQAVSKKIRQLESELNTVLFLRQGNELRLTADGRFLKQKAEAISDQIDDIRSYFACGQISKDDLRVAFSVDAASLLPQFDFTSIQKFNIHFTEHSIKRCITDMENGKVDLCILSCMQKDFPPYMCRTLFSDALMFIVSEELFATLGCKHKTMSIADLANYDILLLSDKEYVYADFLEKYRRLNISDDHLHTVDDQSLMRRLVKTGAAIALAPRFYMKNLPDGFIGLKCSNRRLSWYVTAVYPKSFAGDSRIVGFIDMLQSRDTNKE